MNVSIAISLPLLLAPIPMPTPAVSEVEEERLPDRERLLLSSCVVPLEFEVGIWLEALAGAADSFALNRLSRFTTSEGRLILTEYAKWPFKREEEEERGDPQ